MAQKFFHWRSVVESAATPCTYSLRPGPDARQGGLACYALPPARHDDGDDDVRGWLHPRGGDEFLPGVDDAVIKGTGGCGQELRAAAQLGCWCVGAGAEHVGIRGPRAWRALGAQGHLVNGWCRCQGWRARDNAAVEAADFFQELLHVRLEGREDRRAAACRVVLCTACRCPGAP